MDWVSCSAPNKNLDAPSLSCPAQYQKHIFILLFAIWEDFVD